MLANGLYEVREIKDLKDMIEQSEKNFGSKNAFSVKNKEGIYNGITYTQLKSDMDAFGTALVALGLQDQFVAVIGENRYEWCLSYLAVVNGIGVIVPLDRELSLSEISNLLDRSHSSVFIFSGKTNVDIIQMAREKQSIKFLINMDLEQDEDDILSFRQLINTGRELIKNGERTYQDSMIDPNKMSIILFTSGTTDLAKGVMLSHKNICANIMSVSKTVRITSNDSSLSILPLHHTYECSLGFINFLYNGACISFCEGLKHIAKNMKEVKPTILISVPLILEGMYKKIWDAAGKKRFARTKLKIIVPVSDFLLKVFKMDIRTKLFKQIHESTGGRVRLIITGAAAIEPSVSKWFRSIGISVLQGYGLTECSPLVTGNRDNAIVDSAAGLPIPGVQVKINNPNENGVGEVVTKGENVMIGYFENEEATKNAIKDGWFYTGDMGYLDRAGFLYLTGRFKNVIVTKTGKNIFPEEVELYINKSPYVCESLVLGSYDKESGDTLVSAQIFPNLEAIKEKLKVVHITQDDIMNVIDNVIRNVNKEIPIYKRIRSFSVRENEFIKTTTKKIKRYVETLNNNYGDTSKS